MNNLPLYLLQSGISLALLYVVYWLFLQKETFFAVNRAYLVLSVLFSLLFPMPGFKFFIPAGEETTFYVLLDAVTINASRIEQTFTHNRSALEHFVIIYLTGVAIFLVRFIFQILQLLWIVHKHGITKQDGLRIVFVDSNYSPFSFFNIIFVNRKEMNRENIREIIAHEQVHIRQNHSVDLILLELLTIVQWFNPVIWFYRTSVKSVHEYLADEGVLQSGYNPVSYQQALLGQTLGIQVNDLTNNFNHSLLTKRFIMMTKNKSNQLAKLKVLLVTPVAFLLVLAFTASPVVQTMAQVESKKQQMQESPTPPPVPPAPPVDQSQKLQDAESPVFTVVEEMPQFPGGDEARMKYMVENIKYPDEAKKKGIQGTVYVTFVVEKDGKISDVKVLRGIGGGCDEEAVRVIKNMPVWTPGKQRGEAVRVQFNTPIRFALGDKGEEKKTE
ncbi:MAG: M56 family metallopeptidase [Bacteroidales bacterium]|nr:M56 family metallopeptidase [Bacteroidales bacterium]